MIRHRQTILAETPQGAAVDETPGDCFRTALACLLDVEDVFSVPHFVHLFPEGADWFHEARKWVLETQGGDLVYIPLTGEAVGDPWLAWWNEVRESLGQEFVLTDGPSPRGDFYHVVVADAMTLLPVHDPHPSDRMVESLTGFYCFVPGLLVESTDESVRTS